VVGVGISDLIDILVLGIVGWAQWRMGVAVLTWAATRPLWFRRLARVLFSAMWVLLLIGYAFNFHSVNKLVPIPSGLRGGLSGGVYLWAFVSTGAYLLHRLWRAIAERAGAKEFDSDRRKLVNAMGSAAVAAPFALAGFGGLVQRTDFHVREIDIPIPNLPRDLQGLRIIQLSDIHLGPFLDESELARVIDEARNLRPDLVAVTGDLISMGGDPLDACLRQIARLGAKAQILGCMGNHERYSDVEDYTAAQGRRLGIDFLRMRSRPIRFGDATLNVAGVDYQPFKDKSKYLRGAERLIAPGAVNVLLSHSPDVFPAAAAKNFDFTLSGHTHGGQVNIEILHHDLNIAHFFTPFVYGHYRLQRPSGAAALYVSRGIGTIGLPVRLGAPPEIAALRLVAG
jgi:uncharacterized protein